MVEFKWAESAQERTEGWGELRGIIDEGISPSNQRVRYLSEGVMVCGREP